jgi:Rieske Fe-S protein
MTPLPTIDVPPREQPAWRQAFPIDWAQAHYVARRDFTRFLMLTSLPFALLQVAILVRSWLRRGRDRLPAREVARLDDLLPGGVLHFAYPTEDDPCLLLRSPDGSLAAYSQKCTHLGCPVVPEPGQDLLTCPCHRGSFSAATGRPVSGPPRRPLPRVRLETRGGIVYATGLEVVPS